MLLKHVMLALEQFVPPSATGNVPLTTTPLPFADKAPVVEDESVSAGVLRTPVLAVKLKEDE